LLEVKSIWKDVSELPEEFDETAILWKDDNGNVAIGGYFRDGDICGGITMGNLEKKKYLTLTDYINDQEQFNQDVLERLKKLEGSVDDTASSER